MKDKPRILIADDEPQIRAIIAYVLESKGYSYLEAGTVRQAWSLLNRESVDMVLLDVMFPDGSGVHLCERIRVNSHIPIIMLSALGDEEDRIRGLEAGADDYIVKPFSPREVALRVEAIWRRRSGSSTVLAVEDLTIEPISAQVCWGSKRMVLPQTEAHVLAALVRNQGRTVSFIDLLSTVWNTDETVGGREMVRITVHRLRSHLRSIGVPHDFIETVRGSGYRIHSTPSENVT